MTFLVSLDCCQYLLSPTSDVKFTEYVSIMLMVQYKLSIQEMIDGRNGRCKCLLFDKYSSVLSSHQHATSSTLLVHFILQVKLFIAKLTYERVNRALLIKWKNITGACYAIGKANVNFILDWLFFFWSNCFGKLQLSRVSSMSYKFFS